MIEKKYPRCGEIVKVIKNTGSLIKCPNCLFCTMRTEGLIAIKALSREKGE